VCFVLNYEFSLNIHDMFRFHTPVYFTSIFIFDYSRSDLVLAIKCGFHQTVFSFLAVYISQQFFSQVTAHIGFFFTATTQPKILLILKPFSHIICQFFNKKVHKVE
jgi:hypothetical protein